MYDINSNEPLEHFTITCKKCGRNDKIEINTISPTCWDDGVYVECGYCGTREDIN